MVKADNREVSSQTQKKRKLHDVTFSGEVKRVKQDLENIALTPRRSGGSAYPSRRAVEVVSDVLSRLQVGDRQIASILLREFSIEHLPTLTEDIPQVVDLIITSASVTTYDQIARELLRMLLCILRRSEKDLWTTVLKRLLSETGKEATLFTRSYLDDGLLLLLTEGLKQGAMSSECIPVRVLRCADRSLHSLSHIFRCAAIGFHVARVMHSRPDAMSLSVLEKLLCQMTTDMDSRVRLAAIEGLSLLSGVEDGVSVHTYNTVKNLVGDSRREVRILALRIILVFANKFPSLLITSTFSKSSNVKLQLCDDAFNIVCDAVNDQEVMVRTEAATILGQFHSVSDAFLDQTLDKKLMKSVQDSTGREQVRKVHQSRFAMTQGPERLPRESRWKSSYQSLQSHKQSSSSEWSSGKELNARCPPTGPGASSDDDTESIVPHGACGAFVSALEDEFSSVRRAAVYSLGQLAATRPAFATTALDHLADMFNDEIVEVRLDSIAALTPLIVHGELQKEQLETILKCLDDAIIDSRQALRQLLSKAQFADAECMRLCSRALLNCLHRFPSDKNQIYRCLSEVGARHAVFVHSMVRELLGLHPVYDTREQQIDDQFYIAKLILVLNAAANYEPIISLLPQCVLKHYRFLRAASPELVAPIKVLANPGNGTDGVVQPPSTELSSSSWDVLVDTYERLQETSREPTLADRNALRRYIAEDANAISAYNEPLASAARFIVSLCEISSALESLSQVVLRGSGDVADASNTICQELVRIRCADHQFAGLPPQMSSFLVEAELFLSLLELFVEMTVAPQKHAQIVLSIRSVITEAKRQWPSVGAPSDQALALIDDILESLEGSTAELQKIFSIGKFGHLLLTHAPILPNSFPDVANIRSKWAQISEPNRDLSLEKPVRFLAGLPCGVKLMASLHNLDETDLRNLRIEVSYPDNRVGHFRPPLSDIRMNGTWISTMVIITSSEAWTDAADVTLTLVLRSHSFKKDIFVPLLESPSGAQPSSVQLRVHPMTRT
ncbi:hypothetical protein KIN20_035726 [Parelaphostrongylus tenuis]|uniref:Integrator complex subunit 4/Protein SIEL C-terminal Ig-like domain-containing protein n=1 Tax=Parelaphostrongylus tenuis TaxID=148309 RepID=A0AAD5RC47_PARTN|nr:hypothetical protein KIN20_035726 [Parelaphostrongylus tenuis]